MTSPAGSPLVDEATKLLQALQAWASGGHGENGEHGLPLASDAPECTVCPVCQLLRVFRGIRPDVLEHLAGATGELVAALRAAFEPAAAQPSDRPARTVEKIDVLD